MKGAADFENGRLATVRCSSSVTSKGLGQSVSTPIFLSGWLLA